MRHNHNSNFNNSDRTDWMDILHLVFKKKYSKALSIADDRMGQIEEAEGRNQVILIFLQIFAYMGYKNIAAALLEVLSEKIESEKIRSLCEKTIAACNE